ncbi:MAG: hypothetical protein ACW98D_20605 [Promethearchaeota archaeon]|jgi:hypothetical protein
MKFLQKYTKNERIIIGTGSGLCLAFLISAIAAKTIALLFPALIFGGLVYYLFINKNNY